MPYVTGLRSCYTMVGRLVYFGRMLDKIRTGCFSSTRVAAGFSAFGT